jgi:nickel-dependent lactate racemase
MINTISPMTGAGVVKGNPFHEGCMRAARAIGLDFSINCVYDMEGEIAAITGGGLDASFAAAVGLCEDNLGHRFQEKVDVTIASSYPHTHSPQFGKGLAVPSVITREEGAILMVVPLVQPIPDVYTRSLRALAERSGNHTAGLVRGTMSKGMLFMPDQSVEFNMAAASLILRPQIRTIFVSSMISPAEASVFGMEYAASLSDGLAILERDYPKAQVAVLPSAGLVVPIMGRAQ